MVVAAAVKPKFIPVPVSGTTKVPLPFCASFATVRVPVSCPASVGLNLTEIVQLSFAWPCTARDALVHVSFEMANSAVVLSATIFRLALD